MSSAVFVPFFGFGIEIARAITGSVPNSLNTVSNKGGSGKKVLAGEEPDGILPIKAE